VTDAAKIGLLGLGTVGAAFRDLLTERGDAIEAAAGRRPEIAGVLRRSEGDFDGILKRSEILVELIGGTDPARDYVLRALRAGRHVVTANKQSRLTMSSMRGSQRSSPTTLPMRRSSGCR
jgi:homoserine dehydrogenase